MIQRRIAETDPVILINRTVEPLEYKLRDLMRDARDRNQTLACVPLVLRRGQDRIFLPADDFSVKPDDEILLCSTKSAEHRLQTNLANAYTLEYLVSGTVPVRGWVMSALISARTPSEQTLK